MVSFTGRKTKAALVIATVVSLVLFFDSLPIMPDWVPKATIAQPKATFTSSLDLTPVNTTAKEHAGNLSFQVQGAGGISVDNELTVTATFLPTAGMLLLLNRWSKPSIGGSAGLVMRFCPENAYTFASEGQAFPQPACVDMQRSGNEWAGQSSVVFYRSGVFGGDFSIIAFVKNLPNSTLVPPTPLSAPIFQIDSASVTAAAYNTQMTLAVAFLVAALAFIQVYFAVFPRPSQSRA
jgi:hypothetical protein